MILFLASTLPKVGSSVLVNTIKRLVAFLMALQCSVFARCTSEKQAVSRPVVEQQLALPQRLEELELLVADRADILVKHFRIRQRFNLQTNQSVEDSTHARRQTSLMSLALGMSSLLTTNTLSNWSSSRFFFCAHAKRRQ